MANAKARKMLHIIKWMEGATDDLCYRLLALEHFVMPLAQVDKLLGFHCWSKQGQALLYSS